MSAKIQARLVLQSRAYGKSLPLDYIVQNYSADLPPISQKFLTYNDWTMNSDSGNQKRIDKISHFHSYPPSNLMIYTTSDGSNQLAVQFKCVNASNDMAVDRFQHFITHIGDGHLHMNVFKTHKLFLDTRESVLCMLSAQFPPSKRSSILTLTRDLVTESQQWGSILKHRKKGLKDV